MKCHPSLWVLVDRCPNRGRVLPMRLDNGQMIREGSGNWTTGDVGPRTTPCDPESFTPPYAPPSCKVYTDAAKEREKKRLQGVAGALPSSSMVGYQDMTRHVLCGQQACLHCRQ
eukprot:6012035-Amphidinium_carterae.1